MAIKYVSIFEFLKKYEVPMPLWMHEPELEQDSSDWDRLGQRMLVRKLNRFLEARTRHERELYYKLFPLPFDWTSWMPEKDLPPETAFVGKGALLFRKWEPTCPAWEDIHREDAVRLYATDPHEEWSLTSWSPFRVKLLKDYPQNTQVYSMQHLLLMSYALYRDDIKLYDRLQEALPESRLWRDTWKKCVSCSSAQWKALLPHLLGVGLYRKFTQDNMLRQMLQSTDDLPIVYVDPGDTLLGGEFKNGKFYGKNLYGIALMQVRSELNRVYDNVIFCLGDPNKKEEEAEEDPFNFPFS